MTVRTHSLLPPAAVLTAALLLAAAPARAATPAPAAIPAADIGNNPADPMLGGKDLGPSVACISTVLIRKTRIINESVIMFQVGNKWYRNDIAPACRGLQPTNGLVNTNLQGGQICSGDAFQFVASGQGQGLGQVRGGCLYGRFTPYLPPAPPAK
jgi:hypothetical protein